MDCYKCKYSGQGLSGGHHRSCTYGGLNTGLGGLFLESNISIIKEMDLSLNEYGILSGWCTFPIDFDPCLINHCGQFEEM